VTLHEGDCVEVLRGLADESIDAVVTDPPYGINFMGKAWDGPEIHRAAEEERRRKNEQIARGEMPMRLTGDLDNPDRRRETMRTASAFATAAGEAGSYDFSPRGTRAFQEWVEQWASECLRVLKPGGYLLSFGGTRTYHRLGSGIEDAGFEIRDCLVWMFGQGFPKSLNLAGDYEGWGTALKPAFEPIVMARKPFRGTVAANVAAHGVGALNIDACRIAFASGEDEDEAKEKNRHADFGSGLRGNLVYNKDDRARSDAGNYDPPGRWPANVILGHSPDCVPVGVREVASNGHYPAARPGVEIGTIGHTGQDDLDERHTRGETVEVWDCVGDCPIRLAGSISRFFYCAKTSRAERNAGLDGELKNDHPTVKPIDAMRWLLRLIVPPDGTVLDPFLGSGSTGCAAALERLDFVGIELDDHYLSIADARIRFWEEHGEDGLRIVGERAAGERVRAEREASGQLDLLG
jgi:site-specific DNA-methyltransferase (adenine-specific)